MAAAPRRAKNHRPSNYRPSRDSGMGRGAPRPASTGRCDPLFVYLTPHSFIGGCGIRKNSIIMFYHPNPVVLSKTPLSNAPDVLEPRNLEVHLLAYLRQVTLHN